MQEVQSVQEAKYLDPIHSLVRTVSLFNSIQHQELILI